MPSTVVQRLLARRENLRVAVLAEAKLHAGRGPWHSALLYVAATTDTTPIAEGKPYCFARAGLACLRAGMWPRPADLAGEVVGGVAGEGSFTGGALGG